MRWSVETYVDAIERGGFPPDLRVELIAGQIVEKMPIGNPHDYTTRRLLRTLLKLVGNEVVVGCRGPVRIDVSSRPEPDGWLAKGPDEAYLAGAPTSDDLYLVREVADSSLNYDRETKLEIYARGGVVEYWILNVRDGEIEVHTQPRADGTYASKRVLAKAETLRHERLGEIAVATLFAPETGPGAATPVRD